MVRSNPSILPTFSLLMILAGDKKAQHPLSVVIVGAGLAGLALAGRLGESGHKVVVLEAAPEISEVGAGLTCAPNLTRLLSRWGLDGSLRPQTDALHHVSLRRWEGGEVLGASPLMPEVGQRYGAPQYVVHRADVHNAMMEQAGARADVRVNSMVIALDFEKPSVVLEDGTVIEADLIIGADGRLIPFFARPEAKKDRNEINLS